MTWFKVDDGFHSHPKTLACSLAARGLWVTAGAWAAHHLTEGAVPAGALALLGGDEALAEELVRVRLWRRTRDGYQFHDWHAYQPSRQQVEAERKANAERQRRYRAKRNGVSGAVSSGASNSASNGAPDPTRPPPPDGGGRVRAPRSAAAPRADPADAQPHPPQWCPTHGRPHHANRCTPCRSERIGAA